MLLFLYISGIVIIILSTTYHLRSLLKRITVYLVLVVLSQVFWVVFLILRLATSWGNYSPSIDGWVFFFQMVGSLSAVLNTLHFLLFIIQVRWVYAILSYLFVFALHLGLTWNNYTRLEFIPHNINFTRDLVSIVNRLNLIWIIFMFVFNCLPPLAVVGKLLFSYPSSMRSKWHALWTTDRWFVMITGCQLFNLFLYITQDQLRSNSELLRHDRVWLSFISVDAFTQSLHCMLNALLVERMKAIVKSNQLLQNMTAKDSNPFGTSQSTTKSSQSHQHGTKTVVMGSKSIELKSLQ
jgi:hypothetical protein